MTIPIGPGDNVVRLPTRTTDSGEALVLVRPVGCPHRRFQIDERAAEVTCTDCKEKLSPIWVLTQLANEDRILRDRWSRLRASIQLMGERLKTKCKHCGHMTPIPKQASAWQIQELAEKIKREECP